MSDTDFDTALVTAAFRLAGDQGWRDINVVAAAREGGLPLVEARERFPSRAAILLRFGRLADQAALIDASTEGTVRDRLFDLLMRRFDVMQTHRAGVKALLRYLPTHPPTALLLACATKRSMRWMLQAAGIPATGVRGEVQVRGLLAVWLWGIRAWERDEFGRSVWHHGSRRHCPATRRTGCILAARRAAATAPAPATEELPVEAGPSQPPLPEIEA